MACLDANGGRGSGRCPGRRGALVSRVRGGARDQRVHTTRVVALGAGVDEEVAAVL